MRKGGASIGGILLLLCIGCVGFVAVRNAVLGTPSTATARAAAATSTPRQPTATATQRPPTNTAVVAIAPTPTPRPAAPNATQPPAAAPVSSAPAALRTGGLGKTRTEWEAVYGQPEKESSGFFTYANGNYVVMFTEGRVGYLEHTWGDQNKKIREFAEGAAMPLIPSDATKIEEYKGRSGNSVVRYRSAGLAAILPPSAFIGGEPGDFIIIYRDITGGVTSYLIALGNNP